MQQALDIASAKARCDYAIMIGASASNHKVIPKLASQVAGKFPFIRCKIVFHSNLISLSGLKMYLGETFSTLHMKSIDDWSKHFEHWPESAPICVHAEGNCVASIILVSFSCFYSDFYDFENNNFIFHILAGITVQQISSYLSCCTQRRN